jgi:hypothetical protein
MVQVRSAGVLLLVGALALPGCVVQVVQAPGGSGADSCQVQSVAFLDLARGLQPASAIPPGSWPDSGPAMQASLAGQLSAENALLDRLQIAFDALLYCRWIELRTIRADATGGRTDRAAAQARLAAGRARLAGELTEARAAVAQLQDRSQALARGAARSVPGLSTALAANRAPAGEPLPAVAAATVPLRLRPDPAAPEVGRVAGGRSVTLRPAAGGFALIEAADGVRGYAPAGAFNLAARATPAPAAGGTDLRSLAATNLARRENFAESVEVSGRSLAQGFEEAV